MSLRETLKREVLLALNDVNETRKVVVRQKLLKKFFTIIWWNFNEQHAESLVSTIKLPLGPFLVGRGFQVKIKAINYCRQSMPTVDLSASLMKFSFSR